MSAATPYVFICFSSRDEAAAREIVEFLESEGVRCWISFRDVPVGHNYQETIVRAIEAGAGLVFLFSENSNASNEVKKELSLGSSLNRPVFPLRLSPVLPNHALRYELAIRQWIDIQPDKQAALRTLANTIKTTVSMAQPEQKGPVAAGANAQARPVLAPGTSEFEAVRAALARHIGPIAKVLVEKAASQARSPDELCERLAERVEAGPKRASFLQTLRAQLMVKS